jgi:hypothetical protein
LLPKPADREREKASNSLLLSNAAGTGVVQRFSSLCCARKNSRDGKGCNECCLEQVQVDKGASRESCESASAIIIAAVEVLTAFIVSCSIAISSIRLPWSSICI